MIFICVNAYSQSNKDLLHQKHLNHNPMVNCKTEENIDAYFMKECNVKSKSTFYMSNNREVPAQVFQYDKNGNEMAMLTYDEKGSLVSKVVKGYDNKGNQVSVKSYQNDVIKETKSTTYNEFGNEIEMLETGNSDKSQTKIEFIYDGNNNLIEKNSIGSNGSLIMKNVFKYDNNDRLIEKYAQSSNKIVTMSTYKYDSKGLLIEQEDIDKEINHSMKYTLKYDNSGNLTENFVYSGGTEIYGFKYTYDKNGNNVESEYYSRGKLVSTLYETYDKNNNKIEEVLKLVDGSVYSKTTYTYNEKNLMTERIFWDPKTNKQTGKSIYKFEYYK